MEVRQVEKLKPGSENNDRPQTSRLAVCAANQNDPLYAMAIFRGFTRSAFGSVKVTTPCSIDLAGGLCVKIALPLVGEFFSQASDCAYAPAEIFLHHGEAR